MKIQWYCMASNAYVLYRR